MPEARARFGDRTVANATIPLRAALATAKREGLIRHNPTQGLALPPRQQLDGDEIEVFSPRATGDRHRASARAPQASSNSWRRPACGSAR